MAFIVPTNLPTIAPIFSAPDSKKLCTPSILKRAENIAITTAIPTAMAVNPSIAPNGSFPAILPAIELTKRIAETPLLNVVIFESSISFTLSKARANPYIAPTIPAIPIKNPRALVISMDFPPILLIRMVAASTIAPKANNVRINVPESTSFI